MRELLGIVKDYGGQALTALKTTELRGQLPGFDAAWSKSSQVPGMFSEASAVAFFTILRDLRPTTVVEVGSYLGKSAIFLAETMRTLGVRTTVHAVDPHTGDRQQMEGLGADGMQMTAQAALFIEHLRVTGVDTIVQPHIAPSVNVAATWQGPPIDFLYIDGWHSYGAVLDDGNGWLPHLAPSGVVVFDDYARYRDVRCAVDQLSASTFRRWGTLFGQAIGGHAASPSPAIANLLTAANTRSLQRIFRPRDQ